MTTSASTTSTTANLPLVLEEAMKVRSILCCGHAVAADSSLARGTTRFAVGIPIQVNKSDNRGQVTPIGYAPSPFHQTDRSLPVLPRIKLFVSGMQLLANPSDNIYNMIKPSTQFVSLPLVNSWHQEDGIEAYMCSMHLG